MNNKKEICSVSKNKTGYLYHELYMWHDPGSLSFDKSIEPYQHW